MGIMKFFGKQIMHQVAVANTVKNDLSDIDFKIANAMVKVLNYKSTDAKDLLDYALTKGIEITDSKIGYIYHYSEETKLFTLNSWSKEVMEACKIQEKQTVYELDKTGLWGEVVRQRKPIMINDYHMPNILKRGYPKGHAKLDKYISIPVFDGAKIIMVVGMANKTTDYTLLDIKILTVFMEAVKSVLEKFKVLEDVSNREYLFRESQKAANIGSYKTDFANDSWESSEVLDQIFGIDNKFVKNVANWIKIIHPDDREMMNEYLQNEVIAKNQRFDKEYRVIRANDGKTRWLRGLGEVGYDDKGKVISLIGTIQDITEKKIVEDKLRDKVDELQKLNALMVDRELKMVELKEKLGKKK